jgi:hypothetical protein
VHAHNKRIKNLKIITKCLLLTLNTTTIFMDYDDINILYLYNQIAIVYTVIADYISTVNKWYY